MSKTVESLVWQSALAPELKPVAAVMADMGNDDGLGIYPSIEYLAWLLGRSERQVQSTLKKLTKIGVLDRIAFAAGGRGMTPRYKLSIENLPSRPTWQEYKKGATVAPFSEKGATNDTKRVQLTTQKGATVAPDPLVDPLVEPKTHPAGYRAPKKHPEEKTLYPPENFQITDWMRVHLDERAVGFDESRLTELTADWRVARNADSKSMRTLWNWQHDWLRYVTTVWSKMSRNGNGRGAVVASQPVKTIKERLGL